MLLGLLLDRSGYKLVRDGSPETNDAVEAMILAVARHEITFEAIAEWMTERIRPK